MFAYPILKVDTSNLYAFNEDVGGRRSLNVTLRFQTSRIHYGYCLQLPNVRYHDSYGRHRGRFNQKLFGYPAFNNTHSTGLDKMQS